MLWSLVINRQNKLKNHERDIRCWVSMILRSANQIPCFPNFINFFQFHVRPTSKVHQGCRTPSNSHVLQADGYQVLFSNRPVCSKVGSSEMLDVCHMLKQESHSVVPSCRQNEYHKLCVLYPECFVIGKQKTRVFKWCCH